MCIHFIQRKNYKNVIVYRFTSKTIHIDYRYQDGEVEASLKRNVW